MSYKAIHRAFQIVLTRPQLLVLLAFADWIDNERGDSIVWPSYGRIAWETGYTKTQVRAITRQLVEMGVLVKVAEASQHMPITYEIHFEAAPQKPEFMTRQQIRDAIARIKGGVKSE